MSHSTNEALIQDLIAKGVLRSENVIVALTDVDRKHFVGLENEEIAYADRPLPIGHDQTISQPGTVAFMLELLGAKLGDHILDVGSGSGWTTALLAHIVGPQGAVLGIERIPELVAFAKKNLERYDMLESATVEEAQPGTLGAPDAAPYDRILVSAGIEEIPDALVKQLRIGGVMVIPVKESLLHIERTGEEDVTVQEYPGFAFVPLLP